MNDEDVLTAVKTSLTNARDSLTDLRMNRPGEELIASARARRVRRVRRSVAGASTVAVALGIGLVLSLPHGGQPGSRQVNARLAAWTVDSNPGGTVTLTIRELSRPEELRHTLADAGVPAVVTFGKVCDSTQDLSQARAREVVSLSSGGAVAAITVTLNAIPSGTKLDISVARISHPRMLANSDKAGISALEYRVGLVSDSASLNCRAPDAASNAVVSGVEGH